MSQRFLSLLCAILVLSAITLAPTQSRATSLKQMNYLVGTWSCSAGHEKYTETWAYAVGGAFLRATDSGTGARPAEHALTFAKDGSPIVVDMFSDGTSDILHGTASSAHAALHAVFPPQVNTRVVFNRMAPARYTVDVSGSNHGKPFKEHNVCTKG